MFWNSQSGIFPSNGTTVTDNSIDFGNPNYRFKDLYLSGGVVFGTPSGSATSNTLDDYETGTWTPNWVNAPTGTITGTVGKYTKVGNLVTLYLAVTGSAMGISTYARISNLPFSAAATYQGTGTYIVGGISSRDHGWTTLAIGTSQWYFSSTPATSEQIVASITYTV